MKRHARVFMAAVAGSAAVAALALWPHTAPRAQGTLRHEAYVWQRAWTPAVHEALRQAQERMAGLTALGTQVTWRDGAAEVVRVPVDFAALKDAGVPVGLALRVGAYPGPFAADDDTARLLCDETARLVSEAKGVGLALEELQVDFDCAESKLDGYRVWLTAIRERAAPVPVTFTALPCWLGHRAFGRLAACSDGYVLQVHSLQRPVDGSGKFSLCNPEDALRAIERAARLGAPFRVALPTYSYLVATDAGGAFIGLSAEGPSR